MAVAENKPTREPQSKACLPIHLQTDHHLEMYRMTTTFIQNIVNANLKYPEKVLKALSHVHKNS